MLKAILPTLLLIAVFSVTDLHAQDGHYWTQQYGTKSMLLSGSVIGGVEDLGAVYYNPGRLAQIPNPAFLLSASVYEYTSLKADDAFGASKSVSKAEIKGVPTLAAGTFKVKFLPKHFFAYAIMTRQQADASTSYRNEVFGTDALPTIPGNEDFSGEVTIKNQSNEKWIGLTWSHPISNTLSIGVTTNFVTNTQTKGSALELRALAQSGEVGFYKYNRGFSYTANGLLWKAGLSGAFGNWLVGLTITSPMINLGGNGSYNYEEFYSTLTGLGVPKYSTSYQEGLKLSYKSPVSVGFGVTRPIGRNKIHFSAEWYAAVPKYTILQSTTHYSQSTPTDTLDFILTDQMKSVVNAGLGLEFYISQHVSGFASFSTDFSSVTDDITRFVQRLPEAANSSWKADFFNVGGGVVLDFKGADITLGVTHTGAKQTIPRLLSFPDGSGGPIFDPTKTSELEWDRWRFVFSFSFPFLADYAKKLEGGGEKK